jgi:hypothetical protein
MCMRSAQWTLTTRKACGMVLGAFESPDGYRGPSFFTQDDGERMLTEFYESAIPQDQVGQLRQDLLRSEVAVDEAAFLARIKSFERLGSECLVLEYQCDEGYPVGVLVHRRLRLVLVSLGQTIELFEHLIANHRLASADGVELFQGLIAKGMGVHIPVAFLKKHGMAEFSDDGEGLMSQLMMRKILFEAATEESFSNIMMTHVILGGATSRNLLPAYIIYQDGTRAEVFAHMLGEGRYRIEGVEYKLEPCTSAGVQGFYHVVGATDCAVYREGEDPASD